MEAVWQAPFSKVPPNAPKWLKYKNRFLQLDGYNAKLKIAFEHQGAHHTKHISYYHDTKKKFRELLKRDQKKRQLCKANGVSLFIFEEVPNKTKPDRLLEIIAKQAKKHHIVLPKRLRTIKIDLSKAYVARESEMFGELLKAAAKKNIRCLSKSYLGSGEIHHWKCLSCRHSWRAIASSIKGAHGCPSCANKLKGSYHKLTLLDAQRDAREKGGTLVSTRYKNSQSKMQWKCTKGHRWKTTLNKIRSGQWCAICRHTKGKKR
jgi:hypothetical protein